MTQEMKEILDTIQESYKKGYEDAANKACEWIRYNRWKYEDSKEGNEIIEKDFRKAMKGE